MAVHSVFISLWCTVFSLGAATSAETWFEHYERGLRELERGEAARALRSLEAAVEQRPEPGLRLHTEGPRYVDYLPYLYLVRAADLTGDPVTAREFLARAEEAGVAEQSEEGRELLEAYRVLLAPEQPEAGPDTDTNRAGPQPGYADYERKPVVLSEGEYLEVRRGVLERCGLDEGSAMSHAPWYFHYEMGLELARRADPQRALDALVEASEMRPRSRRSARMYGMWFIDYLPYFEIAKLHTLLGNRNCAADALRISREQGELTSDDVRYAEFLALEEELSELPPP